MVAGHTPVLKKKRANPRNTEESNSDDEKISDEGENHEDNMVHP